MAKFNLIGAIMKVKDAIKLLQKFSNDDDILLISYDAITLAKIASIPLAEIGDFIKELESKLDADCIENQIIDIANNKR